MRIPHQAPTLGELLESASPPALDMTSVARSAVGDDEYPHWDLVRRRPAPEGRTKRDVWLAIKLGRSMAYRTLPLRATDGTPFRYTLPDPVLELLHWIDQHAAGELAVDEALPAPLDRRRYLVSSLIEEAITSSQLEGAATTRRVAKEMLRSGRGARTRDEQMILNNFRAMSSLADGHREPLTVDAIHALHEMLTESTLDDPTAAGRAQRPDEARVAVYAAHGTLVHRPPPAAELPDRLEALCRFANGETDGRFIHPVVRAILLHLWLAYDHPYVDGNGRTARALFYRAMLAEGYWLFEYVSISRLLLRGPAQYARAFLETETDEYDATYFLLHQLRVLRRAIEELGGYLERKAAETRSAVRLLRDTDLNHRQIALVTHALRHGDAIYTVRSHSGSHRVTRQTARSDLLDLEGRGLLSSRRRGRAFEFYPADDLGRRFAGLGGGFTRA